MAAFLIAILFAFPAGGAETLPSMLARINALSAARKFAEAESVARDAVRRFPHSHDARLLLANVLLWQGEYATAGSQFRQLVKSNPRDVNARLGLAQSEYWSGDYRRAVREFRAVLRLQPSHREARRALAEIESASRPGFRLDGGVLSDDQPYDATSVTARLYAFSDPLTKWQLDLAQTHRNSEGTAADTPLLRIAAETTLVPITLRAAMTHMRFPDGKRDWLPLLRVDRKAAEATLSVTVQREELLGTAAALRSHPTAEALSLRWSADSFAVHAEHRRYFDHNRGDGIDAYILRPVARIAVGGSVAYRDTAESRFTNGIYDPYYTPQRLREARLIIASNFKRGAATLGVHLDGGVGRERIAGSFHPWRAGANGTLPLSHGALLIISAERSASAFYTSNEIRASVAGRF